MWLKRKAELTPSNNPGIRMDKGSRADIPVKSSCFITIPHLSELHIALCGILGSLLKAGPESRNLGKNSEKSSKDLLHTKEIGPTMK